MLWIRPCFSFSFSLYLLVLLPFAVLMMLPMFCTISSIWSLHPKNGTFPVKINYRGELDRSFDAVCPVQRAIANKSCKHHDIYVIQKSISNLKFSVPLCLYWSVMDAICRRLRTKSLFSFQQIPYLIIIYVCKNFDGKNMRNVTSFLNRLHSSPAQKLTRCFFFSFLRKV